ncbi:MAG: glycosyltransferase [Thermoplasmatales archaeon]|nr:glycosyltransferase [Thermoplasmatales archaeon]
MTSIGFIIRGYNGNSQYYHANVKPFVDLSYGLKSIGQDTILFVEESEGHLEEKINSITQGRVPIIWFNFSNLEKLLNENPVSHIIVEDNIELMDHILNFRDKGYKMAVFVQYLFGVNTNRRDKRSRSMALTIGSNLPWKFLIKRYRDRLVKFNYILSNSQTCGYLLRQFYDVPVAGTVYPPVGIDMRPILEKMELPAERKGIFVFAGNIENDYFSRKIKVEIASLKGELDEPVKLLVSNPDTASYFSRSGIETYSGLSVSDLVRLYRESKVTYVPTAYELFGHVGAESLMCGTPVILDAYHPFLESVPMDTNAVAIAHPKGRVSDVFLQMISGKIDIDTARRSIYEMYSAEESARSLLKAIEVSHFA